MLKKVTGFKLIMLLGLALSPGCELDSNNEDELEGSWAIDEFSSDVGVSRDHMLVNMVVFEGDGTCLLPPTNNLPDDKECTGKWKIVDQNDEGRFTLKISSPLHFMNGEYKARIWNDEKEMKRIELKSDQVHMVGSYVGAQ